MQEYITKETQRSNKQWVGQVLDGTRESEAIQCRHRDFVLLPDTERANKYGGFHHNHNHANHHHGNTHSSGKARNERGVATGSNYRDKKTEYSDKTPPRTLNWLAILTDARIRTMRDLCGEHIGMLETLRDVCLKRIHEVTGITSDEVMVYLHYHPSVYHLHVHFAYPYLQYNHRDVYRIHSLNNVISNLQIDGDFYQKAKIQVSLGKDSVLSTVYKEIEETMVQGEKVDEGEEIKLLKIE
jgi:hypothetical protein